MRIFILLIGLIFSAAATAEVYRWVNADGSVTYSDRPQPGAEKVDLPSAQTFKAPIVNRRRPATVQTDPQDAFEYQFVEIVRPIQEEVVWNSGGSIDVSVRVEPTLQPGHKVLLFMDNKRVGAEISGAQFTLSDVIRGQHNLRAEVHGTSGEKLIASRPVTFTVQQTSLLNPNNPNAGNF